MENLLQLHSVSLNFEGLAALSDLTWGVPHSPSGKIYGIIGPNGAGKSTLFNLISGIYKPSAGRITFNSIELNHLKSNQIARLGITRTFQNIRLLPHLSVVDNLRVVGSVQREGTFWESLFGFQNGKTIEEQVTSRAEAALELVGLIAMKQFSPLSLSQGDQRRLEIARAIMTEPKLLLLDEPAAGMSASEKIQLAGVLKKVATDSKAALIVIDHDLKFIMDLCDHVTVLKEGKLFAEGTPAFIQCLSDSMQG